jgi:hypothetical protein
VGEVLPRRKYKLNKHIAVSGQDLHCSVAPPPSHMAKAAYVGAWCKLSTGILPKIDFKDVDPQQAQVVKMSKRQQDIFYSGLTRQRYLADKQMMSHGTREANQ